MNHLKNLIRLLCVLLLLGSACQSISDTAVNPRDEFIQEGSYSGVYWPTAGWRSCSPESVGMDSERLKQVYDYVANPAVNSEGIVIVKDGYLVAEAYFGSFNRNQRHASYSIAKSFISSLIGIAINRGDIENVDQPVHRFFDAWQDESVDGRKKRITIRHLLTMSSGLEWNESDYYNDTSQNDVYIMGGMNDFIDYVLQKNSQYEPGTVWRYSSGDSMLLSGILQEATGITAHQYALTHLLNPIGLQNISWQHDPSGHTVGGWGIDATVREYAKFGFLYLNGGEWDGVQLLSRDWIRDSWTPVTDRIDHYGYQWWLGPALSGFEGSGLPERIYIAWGIYTQQIFVVPDHQLLIVRVANDPGSGHWHEVSFLQRVMAAVL